LYQFLEEIVAGYMTSTVKTVTRDVTMGELQKCFEIDDFNAYPVVEDGEVVGLVTKFDFLKCFAMTPSRMMPRYDEIMAQAVAEAMTADFIYVNPATKLTRVLQLMVDHRIRSIPVIAEERRLAGIISREDTMRALRVCTRSRN
jgi:CBS domain-containing protein